MERCTFKVSLEMPEGITEQDMAQYILDAVSSWSGCYHPEHPLFPRNWDTDSVEVKGCKKTQRTSITDARNQRVYDEVQRLIEDRPEEFSFALIEGDECYKINATKVADYLVENQKDLFGEMWFARKDDSSSGEINYFTLRDKILNKEGFNKGKISRLVDLPTLRI